MGNHVHTVPVLMGNATSQCEGCKSPGSLCCVKEERQAETALLCEFATSALTSRDLVRIQLAKTIRKRQREKSAAASRADENWFGACCWRVPMDRQFVRVPSKMFPHSPSGYFSPPAPPGETL